jgi:hypothetical protein
MVVIDDIEEAKSVDIPIAFSSEAAHENFKADERGAAGEKVCL